MSKTKYGLYNTGDNTWHYNETHFDAGDGHSSIHKELAKFVDKGKAIEAAEHLNRFCKDMFEVRKLPPLAG